MSFIYAADIYCDDCGEQIKTRILNELWGPSYGDDCPDGTPSDEFTRYDDLASHLEDMSCHHYDSDDYPKPCIGSDESDTPQHCADCGVFLENDLTGDGADYVRETVREDIQSGRTDSVACTEWRTFYSWIDWEDIDLCEECGELAILEDCDGRELCPVCFDYEENVAIVGYTPVDECYFCRRSDGCAGCPKHDDYSGESYNLPCTD